MSLRSSRRAFIRALPLAALAFRLFRPGSASAAMSAWAEDRLRTLLQVMEAQLGARLGLSLIRAGRNSAFSYRGDERFPLSGTAKLMTAAAVLRRSEEEPQLLDRPVPVLKKAAASGSPANRDRVGHAVPVRDLCAAALEEDDDDANEALTRFLGGPARVRDFARSIGNTAFRLSREEAKDGAEPDKGRNSATPAAMAQSLERLILGDALAPPGRRMLTAWLLNCRTGKAAVRAAAPDGWLVGNKTGDDERGATGELAVLWPPQGSALVLAVYVAHMPGTSAARHELIRDAVRLACRGESPQSSSLNAR